MSTHAPPSGIYSMSRGRLSTNQTFFANGDLAQSYNTFLLSADYSWLDPEETLHVKATTAMAVNARA